MKKGQRWLVMIPAVATLAGLVAGCGGNGTAPKTSGNTSANGTSGSTPASGKKYRIGFSDGFMGNTWRTEDLIALKYAASKAGNVDLIVEDGQNSVSKQISDINSLIAQHVDALLVIPNSPTSLAPVVKKAYDAKIPTVVFNLPISGTDYTAYVGTSAEDKGKRWAEWLVQKLNGKGNIVAFGGIPGNGYSTAAWNAAEQVFKGTNIKVLKFDWANWQASKAKSDMSNLIASYPQIDGIWSDGGQDAMGAEQALLAAGRPLVPTTGDDFNGLLKLYMNQKDKQPKFDIDLISEPVEESEHALDLALQALQGQTVQKQNTLSPTPITSADASKYVQPNAPDGLLVDQHIPQSWLSQMGNSGD